MNDVFEEYCSLDHKAMILKTVLFHNQHSSECNDRNFIASDSFPESIIIIIIEIFIQVKAFSMPKGTVINKGPVFKKVYTLLKMKVIAVWVRYNVKLSNLILKM